MSTKIHHGYRLVDPIDDAHTVDPFLVIEDLRVRLAEVWPKRWAEVATVRAVAMVDRARLDHAELPGSPILKVWGDLHDARRYIEKVGARDPEVDFQCEVTFLQDGFLREGDGGGGNYALLFTEQEDYIAAWNDIPAVQPWPYWNNTDRPDDVTEDEWEHRREVWGRILGWNAPATRGLSWKFLGNYDSVDLNAVRPDVEACIPSPWMRAQKLAKNRVMPVRIVDGQALLRVGNDLDAYKAELAAERARILALLTDVTIDDLYGRKP
jgi:hypothetical protein